MYEDIEEDSSFPLDDKVSHSFISGSNSKGEQISFHTAIVSNTHTITCTCIARKFVVSKFDDLPLSINILPNIDQKF